MAEKKNHHYVPRYYLRRFSITKKSINLVLRKSGDVLHSCSIKHQCKQALLYIDADVENCFGSIETCHCSLFTKIIAALDMGSTPSLDDASKTTLYQAILFQRLRVPKRGQQAVSDFHKLYKTALGEAYKHSSPQEDPRHFTLSSAARSLTDFCYISDLSIRYLINTTCYPFITSDNPVVFINHYLENIKHRGVLGLTTPGLIVVYPISPKYAILLVDTAKYEGSYKDKNIVHLDCKNDVSKINVLQLQNAGECIYFQGDSDADYLRKLWHAHSNNLSANESNFSILTNAQEANDVLMLSFERQLPVLLRLSFLYCSPLNERAYQFTRRCSLTEADKIHRKVSGDFRLSIEVIEKHLQNQNVVVNSLAKQVAESLRQLTRSEARQPAPASTG